MPAPEPIPGFDLYAELGVGRGAPDAEIERAWRARMRLHHPDVAGGDTATARAARLNVAREWLLDPARRARYDALRWPAAPSTRPAAVPPIDPLGAWPERRRRRRPNPTPIAVVALMLVLVAITLGIGTDPDHIVALALFLLGGFVLAWFAILAVFRLLAASREAR